MEAATAEEGPQGTDEALLKEMHKAIHDVTMGIESFGFNAAIAKLYAFTNTLQKSKAGGDASNNSKTPGAAAGEVPRGKLVGFSDWTH